MNCPTTSRGSIAATITATIPQNSRAGTYTGMGLDINVHDQWAVESQGRIHDRTREYLASSAYCLTGECSPDVERCLTARVPVASLISRPSHSSPSQF